jgi:hypothetical protein
MTGRALEGWRRLGEPPPAELTEGRLQLHWAAQVVGAAGRALATPEPDDGHTSLSWQGGVLAGRPVADGRRLALDVAALGLAVLGPGGEAADRLDLAGRTLEEAFDWARAHLRGALRRPDYDMPAHPVAEGAPFSGRDRAALAELARWYGDAALALERLAAGEKAAPPVRCWPHHFDIAIFVPLDPPGADPQSARSVGIGLSPGDESIPEPYWYVVPSPFPEEHDLPPLDGGGVWWTEGFSGGVLRGSDLVRAATGPDQASQAMTFLRSGRAAAAALLGA